MDDIKKQRRELLQKVEEWNEKRCSNCKTKAANKAAINCKCKAALEVRLIGRKLMALGSPAKQRKMQDLKKRARLNFDEKMYVEMKNAELSDEEIRTVIGWNKKQMMIWKRNNDLTGKYRGKHLVNINRGKNKKELAKK